VIKAVTMADGKATAVVTAESQPTMTATRIHPTRPSAGSFRAGRRAAMQHFVHVLYFDDATAVFRK